jgi:ABC-type bacteriocin/lantibiotic exporter with double-glycine peptidase domain
MTINDVNSMTDTEKATKPIVNIKNLNFSYETGGKPNLIGLNCVIEPNSKVILVGANGAGKILLPWTLCDLSCVFV